MGPERPGEAGAKQSGGLFRATNAPSLSEAPGENSGGMV